MIGLIITIILVLLSIFYILKSDNIQDKVVQSLINKVSKKYNIDISVDSSELSFEKGIILKNILLNDQHKDTLVYVKNLKTNLRSLEKLITGDVRISNLYLNGAILKIKSYPTDKTNNLNFFLENINSKKDSSRISPIISISSFKIENSDVRILNSGSSYKISKLEIKDFFSGPDFIDTGKIDGEFETINLNSFSFKSKSSEYLECSFSIDDYTFISDQIQFDGGIKYLYAYKDFFDYSNNSKITSKVKISNFHPAKIDPRFDSSSKVSGELELKGSLNSINIKNLKLDFGFSKLIAEVNILNYFSKRQNSFSGFISFDSLDINDLNSFTSNKIVQLNYFKYQTIKKFFLDGTYRSDRWNLNSYIESSLGNFQLNYVNSKSEDPSNLVSINIRNLDLSKIYNSPLSGFASADLIFDLKSQIPFWKLEQGFYNNKNSSSIKFSANGYGNLNKGNISWKASEGIEVSSSEIEYDLSSKIKKLSTVLDLESYDLSNINRNIGGGKAVLSGVFKTKIEGQSIDDSSIILTVQNLDLVHNGGVLNSSDFYLNSFRNNGIRNFSIINSSWFSGEAIGRFDLSKIDLLINNALSENLPIIPNLKAPINQDVKFEFRLSKDLVNILNTDLQSTEDLKLLGLLSSDKNISYLDIEVPFFQYHDFFAQGLRVNLNNKSSDSFSELIINKAIYKNTNLGEFTLGTKINNKKLSLNFKLKPSEVGGDEFDITFEINKLSEKKRIFYLTDSYIYFNRNRWYIEDNEFQSVIFDNISNSFKINNLKINSNVSEINLNGYYQDKNKFDINLNIQNTNFNQIFKQNDNFTTNGIFNSNLEIKRTKTDNSFRGFIKSSNLRVNKVLVGDLDLSVNGNTQLNSYSINWNVFKNKKNIFLGIGNLIYNKSSSKLDLDISFSDFDISFSSPLGKKSISNIRGYLNGDLNIWGDLNDLQNTGLITLKRAGFSIPYLNTSYSFPEKNQINFYKNILSFSPTKISDNSFNTIANFKAKFDHANFKDWGMDLSVDSDGLMLLNKKETSEALFYGQGFLNGDISMKGPFRNLQLRLDGSTAKGTSIKIPWKDTQDISDMSFIKFIDKNSKTIKNKSIEIEPMIRDIRGLEMEFEMDINNDASVEIVVDQSSGSYLSGRGFGNLRMEINTKGKFNMWGDFTTSDGIYNFKNLGLLDKKFNLKSGGTITWDGNPLGAQMNLNAIYEVPGGANPAILLDNPNFNKKIPTEVGINLQGNLLKPDNPIFEIYFPNTSGTVVSEINYRLSDPQRSQLQAISLLSQGIFINEIGLSVEGITNNLYEKASDIFTSIVGDRDEKLKVGINYLQGDRNADLDIFSEDRLGLTLSTQLSDKILINGKIGVPIGGVNETMIVGDVQIDFILNQDGSLKAKVFNRENEFRYIGDKLGYTQGMGISYNVDFNTFKELLNKIVREAQ